MMKARLLNLWDAARTSYWFLPGTLVIAALLLSQLLPWLDRSVVGPDQVPAWLRTTTDTARTTLAVIIGGMFGVTGTVFSITIVTLSLASQQFGPRLLRRFMYDLPTQITLGIFLGTGLYCLLLLRVLEPGGLPSTAPHLSVATGVALAVASMGMLIMFIHNIASLIQAPNVVAAVASDLDAAIVRLFPEEIGQPADEKAPSGAAREVPSFDAPSLRRVASDTDGYIQAMDGEGLIEIASRHDLVIRFLVWPGQFVACGTPVALVAPASETSAPIDPDRLSEMLNGTIVVGNRRTPRQDVICAVNELVEVAVRALSPGINDPFTAMNCIDRLGAALGRLAERSQPDDVRTDCDGNVRLITETAGFEEILKSAFTPIRQYASESVSVLLRLLEALAAIALHVQREKDAATVRAQAEMIGRMADALPEVADQEDLAARMDQVRAALESRSAQ